MRLLPLLTALLALAALAPAAQAATKMACTNGPDFQLTAGPGRISLPDGNDMYMWGYGNRAQSDGFQMPGPVLCATQGQPVTVSLLNNLPGSERTSLSFPGQSGVRSAGGTPGLLGPEVAPGGTITYSFTPEAPGTYLYESGSNPHKQVHMGLYGALVVRPASGPQFAYDDPATEFNPNREYLVLIHDLDPDLHRAVERGQPYDVTKKHDVYWTINGRSFPDTIADNGASWLPQQPYSSLIRTQPTTSTGVPALIRYVNAGFVNHPFHPHGNHMKLIAQDGRLLRGSGGADTSMESFTRTLGAGQTYDLLFRWVNADQFDPVTNKVPVTVPANRNLTFKDNVSNYSGSPYLGRKSALPAGVTSYNECGEYYFPLHSHALTEFQNFDEGFGGLATLARVDPPAGCP